MFSELEELTKSYKLFLEKLNNDLSAEEQESIDEIIDQIIYSTTNLINKIDLE